jgi:hypothetical protein
MVMRELGLIASSSAANRRWARRNRATVEIGKSADERRRVLTGVDRVCYAHVGLVPEDDMTEHLARSPFTARERHFGHGLEGAGESLHRFAQPGDRLGPSPAGRPGCVDVHEPMLPARTPTHHA